MVHQGSPPKLGVELSNEEEKGNWGWGRDQESGKVPGQVAYPEFWWSAWPLIELEGLHPSQGLGQGNEEGRGG